MTKAYERNQELSRMEKFCREFAKTLNQTEAAKRAGYSPKTAYSIGNRLLKKVEIRARLGELIDLTPEKVVNEVVHIAMARITDVMSFNEHGVTIKSSDELSDRAKAAIKSVKMKRTTSTRKDGSEYTETIIEVTMHDKVRASERLMQLFDLYPEAKLPILAHMQALLNEGVLPEMQAQIVAEGLSDITQRLLASGQALAALPEAAVEETSNS